MKCVLTKRANQTLTTNIDFDVKEVNIKAENSLNSFLVAQPWGSRQSIIFLFVCLNKRMHVCTIPSF